MTDVSTTVVDADQSLLDAAAILALPVAELYEAIRVVTQGEYLTKFGRR